MRVEEYFLKLNFATEAEPTYGRKRSGAMLPVLYAYLLLACGIFARQITQFPIVDLNPANIRFSVLIASFIIGFALLPPVMRWINKKGRKLSFLQLSTAFSIGFLLDLSNQMISTALLPFLRSIRF